MGLLCVQEIPADRPTMSVVNEQAALPEPKQPAAFVAGRNVAEQRPLMSWGTFRK